MDDLEDRVYKMLESALTEQEIVMKWNAFTPDERGWWGAFPVFRVYMLVHQWCRKRKKNKHENDL